MKKTFVIAVIAFFVICFIAPMSVFAEERAEESFGKVTIFAGPEYMNFGDIKIDGESDIGIDSKLGLNVGLGVKITDNIGVEASWSGFRLNEGDLDLPAEDAAIDIDADVDYVSLGPIFSYKAGERVTLNAGFGGYWCHLDFNVSGPGFSESDGGSAFGGYAKAGAMVNLYKMINLDLSAGYRDGQDISIFDDGDVETGGAFGTALVKINF